MGRIANHKCSRDAVTRMLEALQDVEKTGWWVWNASCPLHHDRERPLLFAIRRGYYTLHCFGPCRRSQLDRWAKPFLTDAPNAFARDKENQ